MFSKRKSMKILLIIFLFTITWPSAFGQIHIRNINSRNSYEIRVWDHGKLIHQHTMKPGDFLKIGSPTYKIQFRRTTNICDQLANSEMYAEYTKSTKPVKMKPEIENGWYTIEVGPMKFLGIFEVNRIVIFPKYICPNA